MPNKNQEDLTISVTHRIDLVVDWSDLQNARHPWVNGNSANLCRVGRERKRRPWR